MSSLKSTHARPSFGALLFHLGEALAAAEGAVLVEILGRLVTLPRSLAMSSSEVWNLCRTRLSDVAL